MHSYDESKRCDPSVVQGRTTPRSSTTNQFNVKRSSYSHDYRSTTMLPLNAGRADQSLTDKLQLQISNQKTFEAMYMVL